LFELRVHPVGIVHIVTGRAASRPGGMQGGAAGGEVSVCPVLSWVVVVVEVVLPDELSPEFAPDPGQPVHDATKHTAMTIRLLPSIAAPYHSTRAPRCGDGGRCAPGYGVV